MPHTQQPVNRTSTAAAAPRRIDVRDLLQDANEVRLLHEEVEYRLRITRNRKLILTK